MAFGILPFVALGSAGWVLAGLGLLPLRRRRFVRVMTGRGLVSRDGRGYRYLHPVFRDYGRGRRGGGAEER
jgi:hypothetical protein